MQLYRKGFGLNKFNLTPARVDKVVKALHRGDTVGNIAFDFGIDISTLSSKLTEAGIDSKVVKNGGRLAMRKALFDTVLMIRDDSKRAMAMMAYLDRYPVVESDDVESEEIVDVDVVALIKAELDG